MKKDCALAVFLALTVLFSCTDLSNYYTKDEIDGMQNDRPVSFSARLTASYDWPTDASVQKIVFNDVFSNEGGAYDTSSSTFTVPCDGVYSFSGNVRFQSIATGDMVYVYLKAGSSNYYGDWTYASGTSVGLCVSMTLELDAGTQVQLWGYVNATTPPAVVYGNTTSYYFTSFSGARVR